MDLEDRRMSEPRLPAIPWQDDPEPPDCEWFPDDGEEEPEEEQNPYPYDTQAYHTWNSRRRRGSEGFGLEPAPDSHLESAYEGRYDTEEEEPDSYAGTYSEE